MRTNNRNNVNVVQQCTQRVQALGRFVTAADVILLDGHEVRVADVIGIYQQDLDARAAVASADEARKVAVTTRERATATRRATDKGLRAWVVSRFGEGSAQALAFGFSPRANPTMNVEAKARAKALALATREARHTMGTRQRARIKGVLPADVVPPPSTDVPNTTGTPVPGRAPTR